MKVVISLQPLTNHSVNRGIGSYTRELVSALSAGYPEDKIISTTTDYYSLNADLVHFPFFDPFFLTLPSGRKLPTVVTIHDLIPLKYPSHFPRGIRGGLKWRLQRRQVRQVDHIITDSLASKHDITKMIGIDDDKITVIPLAPAGNSLVMSMLSKVKNTYHLPEKFLLYVGDINWNKNVVGLINNFGKLPSRDTHLVLVGKSFQTTNNIPEIAAINRAIEKSGKAKLIHQLGYVPSHQLPAVYKLATLYCQPSFDEGFGLTILEAMRVGCPVASSNRGSLPEVGGEAVAYFNPDKDMLEVLTKLLKSASFREKLSQLGQGRVKEYTWQKTAKLTHQVYEQILAK